MLGVFALTLFTSATLLFMIQPLVGKMMLPLLGGTPEVWNTCMVFFQAVLLAGYAYAHASAPPEMELGVRWQSLVHLAVLSLPLLLFAFVSPLEINKKMIGGGEASPVLNVLLVLLLSVGLPFFVVSTSAPLLQKWFSSTNHPAAHDPYFLYGASNFGSMLALLGYPLFIEPNLRVFHQRVSWALGYGLLVLCIGGCVGLLWLCPPAPKKEEQEPDAQPKPDGGNGVSTPGEKSPEAATAPARTEPTGSGRHNDKEAERFAPRPEEVVAPVVALEAPETLPVSGRTADVDVIPLARKLRWILLGAVPVSLLMGVTTYMTTDIAAIPLLWIPPLALYLFTFIVVFASPTFQKILMALFVFAHVLIAPYLFTPMGSSYLPELTTTSWLLWLTALASCGGILFLPNKGDYIHRGMILAMPLLILLIVFMMLAESRPAVHWNILLQLETMFVVTMVCHGELARDRPSPKHLTEFFMLMSVGGVVGGVFNALFAPLVFSTLAEYPIALVAACLLLPPLSVKKSTASGSGDVRSQPEDASSPANPDVSVQSRVPAGSLIFELALTVVFLVAGGVLAGLRLGEDEFDFGVLLRHFPIWMLAVLLAVVLYACVRLTLRTWDGPWSDYPRQLTRAMLALIRLSLLGIFVGFIVLGSVYFGLNLQRDSTSSNPITWAQILLLMAVAAGGIYLGLIGWRRADAQDADAHARRELATRILDGLLPFSLAVLTVGLIWSMVTTAAFKRLIVLSETQTFLNVLELRRMLAFGLPVGLCYLLIERSRRFGLGVAAVLMGAGFCSLFDPDLLLQRRSFFGVLKVEHRGVKRLSDGSSIPTFISLVHGTTLHGKQFSLEYLEAARRSEEASEGPFTGDVPLTYFHRTGPLGQVFRTYSPEGMKQEDLPSIGVIGLGTGTTARYGQPGQHMTYYEIDRLVKQVAWDTDEYFRYVSDARKRGVVGIGPNDLKLSDARLAIEREVGDGLPESERYGILIVDAFSSDAIPIHLITKEAVQLFKKRVGPRGLICFHISNRYLDLKPVLANLAQDPDVKLYGLYQNDGENEDQYEGKLASTWVVLCADKDHLNRLKYQEDEFEPLLESLFKARIGALEKDLEELQARNPRDLKDKDMVELIGLKKKELRGLQDREEINLKERELERLTDRSQFHPTEKDLKDLIDLKRNELEELRDERAEERKKLADKLHRVPEGLPGTFRQFFPQVGAVAYAMVLMPNQSIPVQITGFVLSHQMNVPIWYDLGRTVDSSVGVWTDDYASIPSVFTPLKRRQRGE